MAVERIYGRHPVLEALRAGGSVLRVLLAEGQKHGGIIGEILTEASRHNVPVKWTSRQQLETLVERDANHQGVIAELPPFRYSRLESLLERAAARGEPPFLLLLDGIQDVHNFGALLRTAEAAGVHGVIIPERRAASVTAAVYKSSAGAAHYLPVARVTNLTRTMKELKEHNIWFAGLDMVGEHLYYQAELRGPLGLVLGAEGSGLSRLVAQTCDFLVRLPMHGRIASLNASVAGGILLYEVVRQRAQ